MEKQTHGNQTTPKSRLMGMAARHNVCLNMGVDLVFVIDCTNSMHRLIATIKQIAMDFKAKLDEELDKRGRKIAKLRVKVIGFRDFYWDEEPYGPMQESGFFALPDQQEEFDAFVSSLDHAGGGDEPESALEALHFAMNSEWDQDESVQRRIQLIMGFTDASAHPLDDPLRSNEGVNEMYPAGVPEDLPGLLAEWDDPARMSPNGRRMFWFAPKVWPWTEDGIGSWSNVWLLDEGIECGQGLATVSINQIMDQIVNSLRQG